MRAETGGSHLSAIALPNPSPNQILVPESRIPQDRVDKHARLCSLSASFSQLKPQARLGKLKQGHKRSTRGRKDNQLRGAGILESNPGFEGAVATEVIGQEHRHGRDDNSGSST